MSSKMRGNGIRVLAAAGLVFMVAAVSPAREKGVKGPIVSHLAIPSVSPAFRDLPVAQVPSDLTPREVNPRQNPLANEPDGGKRGTWDRTAVPIDPLIAGSLNPQGSTPGLDLDFAGTGNPFACGGCAPPDTTGDVGPDHYIHMVNTTKVAIYDKVGNLLSGPSNLGDLWSSGNCASNLGDPIVVYDQLADRWLLSQFALPNHMCVAISQTPDPTDTYFLYEYDVLEFPDYFKFGVWPDAYYMSANEGGANQYTAYAFDRTAMLSGSPGMFIKFTGVANFMLPTDMDGPAQPATGEPNVFYTFFDDAFHGGSDRLELREFHADFAVPGNSTFTLAPIIPIASFTFTPCGFFNFNCIPQLDTAQKFDALGEWPMARLGYRNFGTHESLVGTFTVGGGTADPGAAVRWFELRRDEGALGVDYTLYQEGTIDPGDGHNRMFGSISMDRAGNIAIGFSVSSATIHPQMHYATRQASDPLGTLSPEAVLIDGAGSQTGVNRWGDYSAMTVEPVGDCTFYHTNEYYEVSSDTDWSTRVGAFTMPNCSPDVFADGFESGDTTAWSQTVP